jgi:hypothetical protein
MDLVTIKKFKDVDHLIDRGKKDEGLDWVVNVNHVIKISPIDEKNRCYVYLTDGTCIRTNRIGRANIMLGSEC